MVNPLQPELSFEQVRLLELIWSPISMPQAWPDDEVDWPKWDYVSRELMMQFGELDSADDVASSLPTVPNGRVKNQPYGLIWRNPNPNFAPAPGEQVGLTIAGLAALARHGRIPQQIPDDFALVISAIAAADDRIQPHPHRVIEVDQDLKTFTAGFDNGQGYRAFCIPERVVAALLWREYPSLQSFATDSRGSTYKVKLGRASLRRYRDLAGARDYLDRIADEVEQDQEPLQLISPLSLVQTFDYLAYVLADDPAWPKGLRFTAAPDLQSAAAVSSAVANREQFEVALNGLLNVINQLGVPAIPEQVLQDRFKGQAQGTLSRLDYWLETRLAGSDGLARARQALTLIRCVRRIRIEAAHGSSATRRDAAIAKRQLGLPEQIHDWPAAWRTIQARVAGALDVIRQAVQSAATPG